MTAGLLIDVAGRFPLGARNGIVTPTAEPVSDTAVTPFGLTLRTIPARDNVVRVRAGTSNATGTDQVTLIETDGRADSSDTDSDYTTDSDQESD
jgi:hypothetical protein